MVAGMYLEGPKACTKSLNEDIGPSGLRIEMGTSDY
jgi:hypothetical protein